MQTQNMRPGEFLLSEAAGMRSRQPVTISGGPLNPGTVLGKITLTGRYGVYDPNAKDGREVASAILYTRAPADDSSAIAICTDARVRGSMLAGLDADAVADLRQLGISVSLEA